MSEETVGTKQGSTSNIIIAIVVIVMFIFCFVPFPFTCPSCDGNGKSKYRSEYSRNSDQCLTCEGSGTKAQTIWKYVNM